MAIVVRNDRNRRYLGGIQNGLRAIPLVLVFAALGLFLMRPSHADTFMQAGEAENGSLSGAVGAGDPLNASGGQSVVFGRSGTGAQLVNTPTQPASFVYSDAPNATALQAYAYPGALVVAGRVAYADQGFKDVAAAGGSVLIYLDAMVDNNHGRYHELLLNQSECGAAVPRWPGSPQANTYGYLTDFRVGGVLQQKLECVLNKMVAENPHMAGWFADDLGSRSYFPNINWAGWSAADKQAYRDGAIALVKTFRKVADAHGLVVMVNGTWNADDGGGYPDATKHGMSLADGALVEHHDNDDPAFFKAYTCSTQWAAESPVTKGTAFHWTVNNSDVARTTFINAGCYAYASTQTTYDAPAAVWTSFHTTGLPSRVVR